MFRETDNEYVQTRNWNVLVFMGVVFIMFTILLIRLYSLQYTHYDENLQRSENNRIRKVELIAERGYIYDRNGEVLVRNRPSYQIALQAMNLPRKSSERDSVFQRLLRIKDKNGERVFDSASVDTAFQRSRWIKNKPIRFFEDASPEQVAIIEEHSAELPGVVTLIESRREYPYGTLASHVLGYTGEISEDQLKLPEFKNYSQGDRIGQKGLEQGYDQEFRGKNGLKLVEVNASGREIGLVKGVESQAPVPGLHLVSTIDLKLQKVAEEAIPDSARGALVAIDPRNGEILAMVSSPRLDPNIFSLKRRERNKGWAHVALDSMRPLTNRAISGTYTPASVFKLVTAGAGLENGVLSETKYYPKPCTGGYQYGARYQKCWGTHGSLNVVNAIRLSCDVFFYQAGLDIDMARINEFARRFGLGENPLGVDIPGEKGGWLPDSASFNAKNKRLGWRWARGLILNLSIGQGQLVTPLQQAVLVGSLATNKGVYRPHFMKELRDSEGNVVKRFEPEIIRPGNMKPETHRVLMAAMDSVVNHPGGTGKRGAVPGIRVGAKTGSGEWKKGAKTHAWYAAVAPLDNPEIAVAVIMEAAGGGGAVSGPIARKVMMAYFGKEDEVKK
ncbi:MAG: penicillin-binding protein 2 [Fibrobacter sp.]|jgi:penicillin-binding protein 2|uniref:penicillin-binding protein 2 n=1 Tax=Fibrobacter sp. UWP2 TaxID=1896216 RepID=UPI0009102136|nr:penicillin-binding protein 2 [Fibrobacter sp. UWP2]MBO7383057.1 penicillin-binding protein 2 [Fibrobacter sp.]SHI66704.1 peptidoglycan glycosyltransferase [Fibrobacter sp. UWP2]